MSRNVSGRPGRLRTPGWGMICLVVVALSGCEMADGSGESILDGLPAIAPEASPGGTATDAGELPDPVIAEGVQVDETEAAAIRDAAVAYVRRETAISDIDVQIDAVAEGWARVRVLPAGSATDPATMYLRQEGNSWRGLTIGTAFAPPDLDEMGVPADVRP